MRLAASLAGLLVLLLPAATVATDCAGTVFLTLDTGSMAQAEDIARVLQAEQVRVTFFVANEKTVHGDRALDVSWAGYWKARVAEGHTFGNHTWSHHYARAEESGRIVATSVDGRAVSMDRAAFCAELQRVDDAWQRLTGRRLEPMWRAPGGRTTQQSIRWAGECGFPIHVGWSEGGYVGDDLPSETNPNPVLLKRALDRIKPDEILLMHLGVWQRREPAAPILEPLIRGLKARGLCFATLSARR
jgi:peptidoglycan/xylan/chitin deacetylase (PgdA/CDA1 family)